MKVSFGTLSGSTEGRDLRSCGMPSSKRRPEDSQFPNLYGGLISSCKGGGDLIGGLRQSFSWRTGRAQRRSEARERMTMSRRRELFCHSVSARQVSGKVEDHRGARSPFRDGARRQVTRSKISQPGLGRRRWPREIAIHFGGF